MRTIIFSIGVGLSLGLSPLASAQTVLAIDIQERGGTLEATPMAGFDAFSIGSTDGTGIQTTPTVRTFGAFTVTLSGIGAGYDDRQRGTPVNSGLFTQELLLRDFVFSRDNTGNGTGGLDVTIDGLAPDTMYEVTVWSFDSSSGGNRVSDWLANGTLVRQDYAFDGRVLPADDLRYQFTFAATTTGAGQLVISGRRKPSTGPTGAQDFGVFLNALQIREAGMPEPPAFVVAPAPVTVYAGDNAFLNCSVSGTAPFWFQWYKDGGEVTDATNSSLALFNAQVADSGSYTVVVTNIANSITSTPVPVMVLPVDNIASGLLAHWSLDGFNPTDEFVPDLTANANDLAAPGLNIANTVPGKHGIAMDLIGVDEYLTRTNDFASLPAYQYPAYTVALWVKGNGVGQSDRRVWAESSNTNNTPIVDIGTVPGGTNGTVDIFIRPTAGGGINHLQTTLVAFDGNWHHIAWVDNNGYGRVYVDGVQDAAAFNYTRGTLIADATCLGGIARTNGAIALFTGSIDDVHVWRRSLTEEEIRTVMDRVRILGFNPGGANAVIDYVTSTPADTHRVQEKMNIADAWSDTAGVVITSTGPNTFAATFPAPGGGQKFYRVVTP